MITFDSRICHITYTHTDCADVWPVYFHQMQRFFDLGMKHIVSVNRLHDGIPSHVRSIVYDDSLPYPQRLLSSLDRLTEFEYVFFDHEDMFLYGEPDREELMNYYTHLTSRELDHIRMIKGGDCKYEQVQGVPSLFRLDLRSKWIFSIQPGFWKRTVLMDILKANPNVNIWDFEVKSQKAVKKLNLKAGFSYRQGAKRGLHHFDNDVYPYIATAIVKGKWNLGEYKDELVSLLVEHCIDPTARGVS
jgi:hypothetical protein